MKTFNKIAALVVFSVFASTAFAEATGEAQVREAAEGTVAKIEEAVNLADQGADKEGILKALTEARQLQKEFRYEPTERLRQKAGNKVRQAREALTNNDMEAAKTNLKEALATYQEMLKIYQAAH